MEKTTTYHKSELKTGTCHGCSEMSDEILIEDEHHRCVDCIEADDFYEETMKGL